MPRTPPFSEDDLREAISSGTCWVHVLRFLGYIPKGGNFKTVRRWAERWGISTDHFDPSAGRRKANAARGVPLEDVLVENSRYARGQLKDRLFTEGLKERQCELCGQSELWRGKPMALVLDHINGVSNDNRLANLRIVCPNCAATFETHCGRNLPFRRECPSCGRSFRPRHIRHRYCSEACWGVIVSQRQRGVPRPERRKVPRPPYEQVQEDVRSMGFRAAGRKYGVSDNAVRKWLRFYEEAQSERPKLEAVPDPPADEPEPPTAAASTEERCPDQAAAPQSHTIGV